MALPAFVTAAILLIPILRNRAEGQLQAIALAILGYLYIGWMFGHLAFLANARNAYGYLLYLVFAVEVNDVAAYTFGKLFGRHPLRSNISPKKTWEGSLGALAVSMALPWLLRFSFPYFTPRELILTGLIVGVTGQFGDLSMSVIKRDVGIKDMGALDSRTRRDPRPHRQPDLRHAAVLPHGGVFSQPSLSYTCKSSFSMDIRSTPATTPGTLSPPWAS